MLVLIVFALLAGLATILSPCILPVLPIVLSSSVSGGRRRPLAVIIGLVTSFALFTLVISQLVIALRLPPNLLRTIAVVALGLLGLTMVVPALNARLEVWLSRLSGAAAGGGGTQRADWWGGLLTGASLGAVWTPCVGSIVAAVISLTATRQVTWQSAVLVVVYAIGVGLPLLAIAYGGQAVVRRTKSLSRRMGRLQQAFGGVVLVTAVLVAFSLDVTLTAWATQALPPAWSARLAALDDTSRVRSELDRIAGVEQPTPPALATPRFPGEEEPGPTPETLPVIQPAPEFTGITNWLNSEPLTLAGLRGKVVLVDFWTYSCINCLRTLPYLTSWHTKYADTGLVLVGVHSPEFVFERDTGNLQAAMERLGVEYAVAQDNDFSTWRAYRNRFWPAKFLIDAEGNIRYVHFGEGAYEETERAIRALLEEAGYTVDAEITEEGRLPVGRIQTPELYIGTARQEYMAESEQVVPGEAHLYFLPEALPLHYFGVEGRWRFAEEYAQVETSGALLRLHFYAKDVYLVMEADAPTDVQVELLSAGVTNLSLEVSAEGTLRVDDSRLYHVVSLEEPQEGAVDLRVTGRGVRLYAFTFGS